MSDSDLLPKPCWPTRDDNVKLPESWFCIFCERENRWQDYECRDCERPRYYQLTQSQARAVARELNRLETENADLRRQLVQHKIMLQRCRDGRSKRLAEALRLKRELRKIHEVMGCGHERRFVVGGDDKDIDPKGKSDRGKSGWCALCELQGVRASNEALLEKMTVSLKEATDETD